MTYPGTNQPGTGTEIRNDDTVGSAEPTEESTPGGREDPTQDDRHGGSSHMTGEAQPAVPPGLDD